MQMKESNVLNEPANAGQIPDRAEAIKQHFDELYIPCVFGSIDSKGGHAIILADIDPGSCVVSEITDSNHLKVDIAVVNKIYSPEDFNRTASGGNPSLYKALGLNKEQVKKMHGDMMGKPIGLFVYLMCEKNICIKYRQETLQWILFGEVATDGDDGFWSWLDCEEDVDPENKKAVDDFAHEAAESHEFILARNKDQRKLFVESHFSERTMFSAMSEAERYEVAERAKSILDFHVTPRRVAEMSAKGLSEKEIAARCGCSASKVKSILSVKNT